MDHIAIIKWGLNFFELLACVTGFIYWYKIKNSYWKWFPVYLAVIVIVELTGKYILYILENKELNIDLYKYFGIPIQFLFFYWLFSRYFRDDKTKHWPLIGAIIYIICTVIDLSYLDVRKFWFSSFSYAVGNVILVILIMAFFIKLMAGESILKYRSNQMFWVCIGLLIFYLGTLPFYGLRNVLLVSYPAIFKAYWYVQFSFGYLMYIFFAISFICSKPN